MKTLLNKLIIIAVCFACLLSLGCLPQKEKTSEQKDLAWCVNICLKDIFKNMHNNGESWGTGSSSMNGMSQDNTFTTIKYYCESIYDDGCYSVDYRNKSAVHGIGFYIAGTRR